MAESADNMIADLIRDNRDVLNEKDLQEAIETLQNAIPKARSRDLDQWQKVRPSALLKASKIDYGTPERIRVYGAKLLTKSEYEKYRDMIPVSKTEWFLDSTDYGDRAFAYAVSGKAVFVVHTGFTLGIRPALEIASHADDLKPGDYFQLGIRSYRLLSDELAICTAHPMIGKYADGNNDYEQSEVKKMLDGFFRNLVD